MTININKLLDRPSDFKKILNHKNVEFNFETG